MITELVDSTPLIDDREALRARFSEDGFVFLRGVVDRAAVAAVRADVAAILAESGWLADGSDPAEARPGDTVHREGDETWIPVYTRVQSLYSFHALAHRDDVLRPIRALVGETEVLIHPRKIARITYPLSKFPTPPHQDFPLIQGAADTYTLWLPFGECPVSLGALRLLTGSHRDGVRPVFARSGVGGIGVDVDVDDPGFQTTDFGPGDAVVFHSCTVHYGPPNEGDRVRLSADYRFQSARDPVVDLSLQPHGHVITAGWPSRGPVGTPEGLDIVPMRDPMGSLGHPPSRYLSARG
jgi:ectoine hydroxylase-related dioxygenase (phytanoyl-CoA dioxygenase family)